MNLENVNRFVKLQTTINNQIDQYGEAELKLVEELEILGDKLTTEEIAIVSNYMLEIEEN